MKALPNWQRRGTWDPTKYKPSAILTNTTATTTEPQEPGIPLNKIEEIVSCCVRTNPAEDHTIGFFVACFTKDGERTDTENNIQTENTRGEKLPETEQKETIIPTPTKQDNKQTEQKSQNKIPEPRNLGLNSAASKKRKKKQKQKQKAKKRRVMDNK